MKNWQEQATVDDIDTILTQTTVYIRCIPGQEWKLWKVGSRYYLQRIIPTVGKQETGKNLTELLLWFTIGDAIQKAQYEPLPTGNVVSFSVKKEQKR